MGGGGGGLTPLQPPCSYSIRHLKLLKFLTAKHPSKTAKLHQENGGHCGSSDKHKNIFKAG